MARYTVKDNATKKTVTFEWEGDAPPTDSDMAEVFSAARVTRSAEIGKGAKMSPQEASTYAADRAAFAQQGGVSTFGTKQGGDTRKISYSDTGYRPNQPAKSLKDVARNAVQDVVELPLMPVRMLSDIANSPDTPRTLKDIGVNMARGPLEFVPGVGEMLGGRSATEAWATNPGFGAMTLAGIGAAGKAMKGKGGAPVAEVAKGGGLAEKTATKLYDMTLKQGTTMKPEIRRQNVREGLQGGYLPNNKGVDRLAADISAAERNVGEGIKAGAEAGVRGNFDRAIANIESLREQAIRSDNPAKNLALINAEIEQLRTHPILDGVTPPPTFKEFTKGKMGPYMKEEGGHGAAMQRLSKEYKETKAEAAKQTGTVPIDQLQRMKVEQGRHVKYQEKNGQAVDPFKASVDKARIRGFKEELETQLADVFPELKDQNAQLSRKYKLQDVLERAANRIENNQGIGIGLPIKGGAGATIGGMVAGPAGAAIGGGIGTLIGIIEHPAVAPRLAVALYRASKGKMTMVQARTAADDRLKYLKDKLKDERGVVGKDIDTVLTNKRGSFGGYSVKFKPQSGEAEIKIVDGEAVLFADDALLRDKDLVEKQVLPRAVRKFISPLDDDVYVRVTNNTKDYGHVKSGTHKGSSNHATGDTEYGLSVAKTPEFPAKHAYLVRGKKIADGSDGEPILDTSTISVAGPLMPYRKFVESFEKAQKEKAKKLGLTQNDIRKLFLSTLEKTP